MAGKKELQMFPELEPGFELVGVKWRKDEHCEQVALVQWASWMKLRARRCELPPIWEDLEWLFAVPNGGDRDRIVAGRMKAEGVVSGVADLCLPVACGGFFGLWIEMKRFDGGVQSENQLRFERHMKRNGYAYALCHGVEQGIKVIRSYIAFGQTPGKFVVPYGER